MNTEDFITELFCHVDDELTEQGKNHKHSQAKLYPSEVVTKDGEHMGDIAHGHKIRVYLVVFKP